MKLLKIDENHQASFLKDTEWIPIISIERDDLVLLIDAVAVEDNVELDECSDGLFIADPTAKLIYEKIYTVLKDLIDNRDDYLIQYKSDFEALKVEQGLAGTAKSSAEIDSPETQ